MATRDPILLLDQVSKSFHEGGHEVTLFQNLSLALAPADTVAITGPSGSGKSTLLNLCVGLDEPSEGRVKFAGEDWSTLAPRERTLRRRGRIGFLFQDFRLIRSLTALENVLLPLQMIGRGSARSEAMDLLRELGLADCMAALPERLSGGEQQRVALARALVTRPAIIFCDEPTGSLDRQTARDATQLLFSKARDASTALVVATHDPDLAASCDREIHLDRAMDRGYATARSA